MMVRDQSNERQVKRSWHVSHAYLPRTSTFCIHSYCVSHNPLWPCAPPPPLSTVCPGKILKASGDRAEEMFWAFWFWSLLSFQADAAIFSMCAFQLANLLKKLYCGSVFLMSRQQLWARASDSAGKVQAVALMETWTADSDCEGWYNISDSTSPWHSPQGTLVPVYVCLPVGPIRM